MLKPQNVMFSETACQSPLLFLLWKSLTEFGTPHSPKSFKIMGMQCSLFCNVLIFQKCILSLSQFFFLNSDNKFTVLLNSNSYFGGRGQQLLYGIKHSFLLKFTVITVNGK